MQIRLCFPEAGASKESSNWPIKAKLNINGNPIVYERNSIVTGTKDRLQLLPTSVRSKKVYECLRTKLTVHEYQRTRGKSDPVEQTNYP